ncbi:hypothetical protein ACET3Z_009197 [Daucus carota]
MTDYQVYLVYSLLLIISSITLRGILKTRNTSSLPPSPPRIPIIGHLHLLAPIPHQALHKLSTRYGPLIHLYLGSKPCIVASSPEMATEILKTHEASWLDRPKTEAVDYLTYGSQDFAFATYGPYWKFVKKLCMSELLSGRTLDLLQPIRRHEIESMVNAMMKKARAGEAADVRVELIRLANNTFSSLFMGKRWSENEDEAEEVHKLIQEITELAGKFNFSDYIWFCKNLDLQGIRKRVVDVRGRFDNMMERIIEERRDLRRTRKENGDGGHVEKDLLDILLDISEDESREIKLSRENIKAFTLDLFFAGSETSATATEWALAELINHPDIMKEARQEIDTIPAKTRLFVNVWALGRDSDYWENALEFIPERFFLSSEDKRNGKSQLDVRGQHFQVLPFGSGRRGCPGISLALRSVQTTLAVLIQCFEWEVRGEGQNGGSTVNMEEGTGLTISRARPLVCVPVARLDPFPSM